MASAVISYFGNHNLYAQAVSNLFYEISDLALITVVAFLFVLHVFLERLVFPIFDWLYQFEMRIYSSQLRAFYDWCFNLSANDNYQFQAYKAFSESKKMKPRWLVDNVLKFLAENCLNLLSSSPATIQDSNLKKTLEVCLKEVETKIGYQPMIKSEAKNFAKTIKFYRMLWKELQKSSQNNLLDLEKGGTWKPKHQAQ